MKFRTLHELGHDEKTITLIDDLSRQGSSSQPNGRGSGRDIILIPHPTNDINDPLRFPAWKKWAIFTNVLVLTFMCNAWLGGLAPAFYLLTQEFNISVAASTNLLIWPLLAAGLCNFFWVPTADYIGRRPVFVICALVTFACQIWAAASQSYGSLLAARVVGSFTASCHEALGAVIVNDIFFLHERGAKMGIFVLAIYMGNSLGSVVSGFVVQGLGWRWTSWICSIISGLNLVGIVFCFPETRYTRSIDSVSAVGPPSTIPDLADEKDISSTGIEKADDGETIVLEHANTTSSVVLTGTKNTYWQELKLWSSPTEHSFLNHLIRPFPLLAYPAVAWAVLTFSVALAWLLGAGSLSSFIFQIPPYNFGPGVNGLVQLAGLIGNIVGAYAGGNLSDMYVRYHARSHEGKFLPESRLVVLIVPAVIGPCGLLLFGFGAERTWHWAILYVGCGMISVVPAAAIVAMTYTVDSYFEVAAEALLVINGLKAVAAWGFTYGFIPWTEKVGYATAFGTMAGIWWFTLLLAVPLYIWGPRVRKYSTRKMKVILF